jgi:hypothetical protein
MIKHFCIYFILTALCHSFILTTVNLFSGQMPTLEIVEEENHTKDGNELESSKLSDLFFQKNANYREDTVSLSLKSKKFCFLHHYKESLEFISIDYPPEV